MILIADSGSTNTTWCLAEKGSPVNQITTSGINPYFQTEEEIREVIARELDPYIKDHSIKAIYYYGAGCAFGEQQLILKEILSSFVPTCIEVSTDLLGAARSLCGREAGIVCILGTGSNSCFYDGRSIIKNVSPLGYILGDEGGGAVLGKLLVGDCLKNQLPKHLSEKFLDQYQLTPSLLLENVYKKPFPNRFLAKFSCFLEENIQEEAIYSLVHQSFCSFFTRNVMQYDNYQTYPIHFIGSVAYHFRHVLLDAAAFFNLSICSIEQSPVNGLLAYHTT